MTAPPRLALLAGLALAAGCATGYRPEGPTGGFRETPLAEDAYRIEVRGNSLVGARWVDEAALVRAAELTRRDGFRSFLLLNDAGLLRTMGAVPCPEGYCTSVVAYMFRSEGEPGAERGLDPDKVLRRVGPRVGYRPTAP
jgi:hypothetical protein